MGRSFRAARQDRAERKGARRLANPHDRAGNQGVPRSSAGRANGGTTCARGRSAAQTGREGSKAVSVRPLLVLLLAVGCATPARPQILTEVDRTREGRSVVDARKDAPQALARAELVRGRAEKAFADGDLPAAQILGEQALAAYLRATLEARLTLAETRLAQAKQSEKQQAERLPQPDSEQQRLAAEAPDPQA